MLGYVVCSVRSGSSGSSAVEGFRRLRAAEAGFSIAIMLVSSWAILHTALPLSHSVVFLL